MSAAPTAFTFRARGAFHRRVPFSLPRTCARDATSRAATGTPVLPPKAQLPTRFHARSNRSLDPTTYRLFTGATEPHAARRLLQLSDPRAHQTTTQTPPLDATASRRAMSDAASCEASPTELSQARGRARYG